MPGLSISLTLEELVSLEKAAAGEGMSTGQMASGLVRTGLAAGTKPTPGKPAGRPKTPVKVAADTTERVRAALTSPKTATQISAVVGFDARPTLLLLNTRGEVVTALSPAGETFWALVPR
jgi:hypothetical protein